MNLLNSWLAKVSQRHLKFVFVRRFLLENVSELVAHRAQFQLEIPPFLPVCLYFGNHMREELCTLLHCCERLILFQDVRSALVDELLLSSARL